MERWNYVPNHQTHSRPNHHREPVADLEELRIAVEEYRTGFLAAEELQTDLEPPEVHRTQRSEEELRIDPREPEERIDPREPEEHRTGLNHGFRVEYHKKQHSGYPVELHKGCREQVHHRPAAEHHMMAKRRGTTARAMAQQHNVAVLEPEVVLEPPTDQQWRVEAALGVVELQMDSALAPVVELGHRTPQIGRWRKSYRSHQSVEAAAEAQC